ncbi:hypothetical protein CF326_g2870 [Tilletia indica]|nr:hypothetical protein CF326_g2870 [Tilletia indica]
MAGSSSPAAKRAALAPKTQRTPRKSSTAAASIPASQSTALASLADTLPDTLTFNDDEPTLGERVTGSSSSRGGAGARNTHSLPNGTRKSSKAKLANGSATAHQDDDPEDDDEDEDSPNGVLTNGKSASKTRGAQPNGVSGEGEDDDDLTPFPLPASVSGNPLASSPALSHALNQALHSADKALLSSILAHSEPLLIRSTVQRLSGSQALLLLEQCVARLVGSTQGGGGTTDVLSRGTSTGKVRTTVEWIRSILLLHTAYLMALPHLTTRLASLHMALSSRLASHNRLIGLQGRLDLVLSQIEMRSAYAAAAGKGAQGVRTRLANSNAGSAGGKKGKAVAAAAQDPTRWVEPSDDEDDDDEEDDEQGMELDALKNDDDDDDDGDEEDDDDDEEDDDEDDLELSPVLPAEELEDDSDIEDIMLGASPSRQRRRNQTILSDDDDDDDDEGNTTADSGDEAHMAVTASTLRARALAERKKASAGAGAYEPADDAVGSKRGKRGVGAAATEAAKKKGKGEKKGKGDEMDVDDDDGEEGEDGDEDEDDESLLDEEGDSELEDDDEEDDEDHADYGMADMEAESTDGEEEEDETEEE